MAMLEIEGLTIGFGNRTIVSIDELEIGERAILGLAGESGSGKSLTGLAVLGLTQSVGAWVKGSVRFQGVELVGAPDRTLRELRGAEIGLILQGSKSAFSPVMQVGTTFLRALRLHGVRSRTAARSEAVAALQRVLLPAGALERYPHELSGGQLQRIAIALALALNARLVVADEPTSALDVSVQAEILALLLSLRESEGVAFLFISHDLGAMAELADTIAVMRDGSIVEHAPTAQLVSNPRDPYTRRLLDAVPTL